MHYLIFCVGVQVTGASESRDDTEKDGAGNQDSEEENHEEEEDQTGNSWGHAKLPIWLPV
jgi:hypothetical protein